MASVDHQDESCIDNPFVRCEEFQPVDSRCRHYGPVGGISKSPADSRYLGSHFDAERKDPAEGMIEGLKNLVCMSPNPSTVIALQDGNLQ